MSEADKMFEELGTIKEENESFIIYRGTKNKDAEIRFYKSGKSILLFGFNEIRVKDLKAINKKVEELQWIEITK